MCGYSLMVTSENNVGFLTVPEKVSAWATTTWLVAGNGPPEDNRGVLMVEGTELGPTNLSSQ